MNALELAKLLETDCWYMLITREGIATMLRQQQAEIDALKSRELTDEEIDNLIMEVAEKPTNEDLYDFAREILRKAKEK